jgi:sigma-B regulation protein RsbU (phosphoserine phosphatase)
VSEHLVFQRIRAKGLAESEKQAFKDVLQDSASPLDTLFIATTQEELWEALGASPVCDACLIGSPPGPLLEYLRLPENNAGEHLLTLVGECRFLYGTSLAEAITDFLDRQNILSAQSAQSFRLILQEALSNAIEHGNLNMASERDKEPDPDNWFDDYYDAVLAKLHKTEQGKKPICLSITLKDGKLRTWVEDQGQGFDLNTHKKNASSKGFYGHGLTLITSLSEEARYDKEGRRFFFQLSTLEQNDSFSIPTPNRAKKEGRILIVDDQKVNRNLVAHFLRVGGYKQLEMAENGKDALQKVEIFEPDLILMDVIMPEMDGFETCQALKANPKTSHIPVLFLSGLTDVKSRTQGYRLGAVDYVNKPIDRNELVARAEVHILNGMLFKSMQAFSQRLINDLDSARHFQLNLLPSSEHVQSLMTQYPVILGTHHAPCDELAGDYFQVFPIDETTLAFIMADFTGHGVLAALHTTRLHSFLHELEGRLGEPEPFIRGLNTLLHKTLQPGYFATCAYGTFNTQTGEGFLIGNGAPEPAILPANRQYAPTLLDASGLPLGLVGEQDFLMSKQTFQLTPGDTLLLYSDALIETPHGEDGIMWADMGFLETLKICQQEEPPQLIPCLLNLFNQTAQHPIKDDLTLLSLTFQPD